MIEMMKGIRCFSLYSRLFMVGLMISVVCMNEVEVVMVCCSMVGLMMFGSSDVMVGCLNVCVVFSMVMVIRMCVGVICLCYSSRIRVRMVVVLIYW